MGSSVEVPDIDPAGVMAAVLTAGAGSSLHLSTALLGTRVCLVMGHTDCGLEDRDGSLPRTLRSLDPMRDDWDWSTDVDEAVRDDVDRLLAWPGRPDPWAVAGAVIDVTDGSLRPVTTSTITG